VEKLTQYMIGFVLVCLGFILYMVGQVSQIGQTYDFISIGCIVAGAAILAVRGYIWALKLLPSRSIGQVVRAKSLSEALLYGITGFIPGEAPVWRTKLASSVSGLPHTVHKICPSCSRPVNLDSRFCEFCGFEFHARLDAGLRMQSMTPVFATADNVTDFLQQVYRDDGVPLGMATGRADPLGDILSIKTVKGVTYECEVRRLLLVPLSPVPGEFKGSLIVMPEWFAEANEVMALANAVRVVSGLVEQLTSGKISETEFSSAYRVFCSEVMAKPRVAKVGQLETELFAQKPKLLELLKGTADENAKALVRFELRTIDSMLSDISLSRERLKRFVIRVESGNFSGKIKDLVSATPNF